MLQLGLAIRIRNRINPIIYGPESGIRNLYCGFRIIIFFYDTKSFSFNIKNKYCHSNVSNRRINPFISGGFLERIRIRPVDSSDCQPQLQYKNNFQ